jgi:lipid II:glycine glycyltransferase (peptidoglycan interpeptide bridge formation enzyme)
LNAAAPATARPVSEIVMRHAAGPDRVPGPETLCLTWTRHLTGRDADDHDAFVRRAASGHYAQTRRWADIACAGRPFAPWFVLVRNECGDVVGAALVLRACWRGLPLPYAVVERGPVVDAPALFRPVLALLARAARRRGILRLAVMPYWESSAGEIPRQALRALGWTDVQKPDGLHARTMRLSTAGKADAELFASSTFKSVRRNLRLAEQAGAQVRRGTAADLPAFVWLYDALMRRQGRPGKSAAWLRAMGACDFGPQGDIGLFLTEVAGRPIAVALTVRHERLVTFALGASDQSPSKLSKMVPSLVAAIRWARDLGADFDLGGIPAEGDTDPKRLSIALFKREFAQEPVPLLGQHARWLW